MIEEVDEVIDEMIEKKNATMDRQVKQLVQNFTTRWCMLIFS